MTDDLLRINDEKRVRRLTLNRPQALNAFNDALYAAVTRALKESAADGDVAVVVLTGKGRAFSAGQDLGELADGRSHEERMDAGFRDFIETVEAFPKPLIAAVNGIGVGIGLTLLPHCDFVLMAESARLKAPFVSLGVSAEAGSSFLLPATIGAAATAKLFYTGDWLEAPEAVACGLAQALVPDAELQAAANALAAKIAAMPVAALGPTRNSCWPPASTPSAPPGRARTKPSPASSAAPPTARPSPPSRRNGRRISAGSSPAASLEVAGGLHDGPAGPGFRKCRVWDATPLPHQSWPEPCRKCYQGRGRFPAGRVHG
jgi:enoyl-CoA hydratase/carnithine racemase